MLTIIERQSVTICYPYHWCSQGYFVTVTRLGGWSSMEHSLRNSIEQIHILCIMYIFLYVLCIYDYSIFLCSLFHDILQKEPVGEFASYLQIKGFVIQFANRLLQLHHHCLVELLILQTQSIFQLYFIIFYCIIWVRYYYLYYYFRSVTHLLSCGVFTTLFVKQSISEMNTCY